VPLGHESQDLPLAGREYVERRMRFGRNWRAVVRDQARHEQRRREHLADGDANIVGVHGLDYVGRGPSSECRLNLSWIVSRGQRDRLQARNPCAGFADARHASPRRLGHEDARLELLAERDRTLEIHSPPGHRDSAFGEHLLDRLQPRWMRINEYCGSFADWCRHSCPLPSNELLPSTRSCG
jgi:hypothetical protein